MVEIHFLEVVDKIQRFPPALELPLDGGEGRPAGGDLLLPVEPAAGPQPVRHWLLLEAR